jgi:hypothetical protein
MPFLLLVPDGYKTTATSTRSALASTDSTLYDSALTFYSANKKEVSTSALVTSVTDGPRTGYASGTGIGSETSIGSAAGKIKWCSREGTSVR